MRNRLSMLLVQYRIGRVVLHVLCAVRDRRWKWHADFIRRFQ